MTYRLLFISRDPGSVQAILPVFEVCRARANWSVVAITHPDSRSLSEKNGYQMPGIENFGYFEEPEAAIETILVKFRPDLIVSGSSPRSAREAVPLEQRLIRAASRRSIPTLTILDTWDGHTLRFAGDDGTFDPSLVPTRLCVLDHSVAADLVALGVESRRIAVTHNPWFDAIANRASTFPGPPILHERIVLFASQPLAENRSFRDWGYDQETIFQDLVGSLHRARWPLPARIVIWSHPREDGSRWTRPLQTNGISVEYQTCRDRRLVANADLLVNSHSTLSYEAAYFGTPVLSYRIGSHTPIMTILERLQLTHVVRDIKAMDEWLSRFDSTAERSRNLTRKRKLQARGCFFSDGAATARVMTELQRLLVGVS